QGLSNALVGSILAARDGSVWLSTYNGLNRWTNGQVTIPPTGSAKRDGKLSGRNPHSLFQDDSGRIWITTLNGAGYLENGQFISISGVPDKAVTVLTQDTAGNLWIVNERVGLVQLLKEKVVRQIPWASLGHQDHASARAADRSQGGLWIGFFLGGISYFKDGQIRASYSVADGLTEGRISDFRFDREGALWIAAAGGLSRLKNGRITTLTS